MCLEPHKVDFSTLSFQPNIEFIFTWTLYFNVLVQDYLEITLFFELKVKMRYHYQRLCQTKPFWEWNKSIFCTITRTKNVRNKTKIIYHIVDHRHNLIRKIFIIRIVSILFQDYIMWQFEQEGIQLVYNWWWLEKLNSLKNSMLLISPKQGIMIV